MGIIRRRAVELIRRRQPVTENAYTDVTVWQTPEPVPPSRHGYKYRLAYVVKGVCVIRYDNERGKGDHRHWGRTECPYVFTSLDTLLTNFEADIGRWNDENRGA